MDVQSHRENRPPMDHAAVVRKLIERTARDFSSYFEGTPQAAAAERIMSSVVTGARFRSEDRELVESMLPDTEDDGRWEASYALNTGAMVLSLIDFLQTRDEEHYRDAVTLFFDTVDFKVHQELESRGVTAPSEDEIATHPLFVEERAWFAGVESGA
jgi:hypothetical protein